MPRKLPDYCFKDAIPVDEVSTELFVCHLKCAIEYNDCNGHAETWDDLDKCEREYDDCFYNCCEKYA